MKIFIISTFALGLYIIFDLLFNDQMWDANTELTVYLQENQFQGEKEIFLFFSYSLFAMPGIALIAFLFFNNKLGALIYCCLVQAIFAENSVLKNIYHQARPFFIENKIQPFECNKEFGKPSGHAMTSSAMCFLIPYIIFPSILKDQQNQKSPLYLKILIMFVLTIWTFMTGFSRIFMGVHSLGQILLGWVYTAYNIIIYLNYFHNPIMNYIRQCLQPGSQGISNKVVSAVGLFAFGWTCLSILFFELNNRIFLDEDVINLWLDALYNKCLNQQTHYNINSPQVLHNICLSLSLYIWFPFSFLLGVKLSKGIYNENQFRIHYKLLTFWQKLFRILILLILLSILIPIIFIQFQNTYAEAFGKFLTISILGGLFITVVYSNILSYFKLEVDGDFLQVSPQITSNPEGYKESELGQIVF